MKKDKLKNSRILQETMNTLKALWENKDLQDSMPLNQIQVHMLEDEGDGIVFCLEYDERTRELNKTFHSMEEYYDVEGSETTIVMEYDPEEVELSVDPNIPNEMEESCMMTEAEIEREFDQADGLYRLSQAVRSRKNKPLLN